MVFQKLGELDTEQLISARSLYGSIAIAHATRGRIDKMMATLDHMATVEDTNNLIVEAIGASTVYVDVLNALADANLPQHFDKVSVANNQSVIDLISNCRSYRK